MSPGPRGRPRVIVAGGGLCGLTAARYLKADWEIFEAGDRPGGLARSEARDGHVFDRTGHWLHLGDPGLGRMVKRLMGDSLREVSRRSRIFSHGVLTRYPFQANLHGLPPPVVFECLRGFLDRPASRRAAGRERPAARAPARTFEEFILEHFGEGIARHFMVPYNERLWGVHPRELTDSWCRRFVPVPQRDEVLAGAVGHTPAEMGYNARFLYPGQGGIERLVEALVSDLPPERIHRRAPVEHIDHLRRKVRVGGEWLGYDALVSTLPLPDLCGLLAAPPRSVVKAAQRLRWTSVRYLDVALSSKAPADYHWIYLPEAGYPAYRLGIYDNVTPSMAPPGGSSLYVELASRGTEPADELMREVVPMLLAAGAMRDAGDLRFAELREIEKAYVIFDSRHARSVRTLLTFFERHHIYPRGRYGRWDYGSMEDSMLDGREVAKMLSKRYKSSPDEPPSLSGS